MSIHSTCVHSFSYVRRISLYVQIRPLPYNLPCRALAYNGTLTFEYRPERGDGDLERSCIDVKRQKVLTAPSERLPKR
jgi:hypothetical protein